MFQLPLELVDLIFEFRDGNKKDNFDKVLTEFKSNVEYIREKMTTLYDDDYPITLTIDDLVGDFNLLYFSFFKSYKIKMKETFDEVLDEFKQIRDYNWENYCWFGIGNHPDDVTEEFRWTKRIHDGDCWEYVYRYNFNYIEYKLNRKLEDFLYHEFNEE